MKIYLISLFLSLTMAYLYQGIDEGVSKYEKNRTTYIKSRKVDRSLCNILAVCSALPFIIITGLRYHVGTDYLYYAASFNRVSEGKNSYFKNPLYNLFEWISSCFSDDFIILFCITAVILIVSYWSVIYKRSCFPVYSIFLFWGTNTFYISLNGVRQGLAMGFLFIAIHFAIEKKLRPYLVAILCAVLTHRGVAFFLPFYWLIKIKLTPRRAWTILLVSVGVGVVGSSGLRLIIRLIGYGYYMSGMFDSGNFEWIITLINLAIFCVFCFYYGVAKESEYEEEYQTYFWLQMLATVSILLSVSIPLAKRICWSFSIGQILSLPLLTKFEDSKIGKLILNVGIIAFFTLSIYFGIVVKGAHKVLPYRWFTERL